MRDRKSTRLPFQPGEASWASWKCGGGSHLSEFEEPYAPEPQRTEKVKAPLTETVTICELSDAMPSQQNTDETDVSDKRGAGTP